MSNLCIRDLVEITGGRLQLGALPPLGGDLQPLGRVVVDCRQVRPGDVYWPIDREAIETALPEEAFARAALGVVTSGRRIEPWAGKFAIQVEDSHAALRQLVRAIRCRFTGFVVAVAGVTGKTTAATWIEQTLAARGPVFRPTRENAADFDPRALLDLDASHRFGVFEMSAASTDVFTEHAQWISPHCAVLLNATSDWDDAPDMESISRRLHGLRDALPSQGTLIVNGDDELLHRLTPRRSTAVIRVGRGVQCDWSASRIRLADGWLHFTLEGASFRIPATGRHQIYPALAAYAVGRLAGLPIAEIADRLATVVSPETTCQMVRRDERTLLVDWPRSRPLAARAALAALRDVACAGRRIVVAGDLFRDHPQATRIARDYGNATVTRFGADLVVSYGPTADSLVHAASEAGIGSSRQAVVASSREAAEWVRRQWRPGDSVLVTGASWEESRHLVNDLLGVQESAAA